MNGDELRQRRLELGYKTQDLLSKELRVSRPTIVAWEKSERDLDHIVWLAIEALARNPELRSIGADGLDITRRVE
jgi:DNA-binding XRE family transcriptional regulator